jgi:hypothetical protein
MTQQSPVSSMEHPHTLGSFRTWLTLLAHAGGIDPHQLPRAFFVTLSTLLTSPLRAYERLRYGSLARGTPIHPAPIFIIGHWRSGTTFLFHLLCQDPDLGYLTTFQAMAPGFCLLGERTVKRPLAWLARKRHPTREIDNIPLLFDSPEEDELAMANLSPYSFLHSYTFPRRATYIFESYVLFDGPTDSAAAEWSRVYLDLLRKATLRSGGKRLAIKNCSHTARIRTLLGLFPDARFIHIYRNPYDVFQSTRHLYVTVLRRAQLQDVTTDEIESLILRFYPELLRRFLMDRALIPPGHLVEVKYEDLEEQPLRQMRRVYESLGLPGFAQAEPGLRAYLASVAGYEKNVYQMDDGVINKVNEQWGFALDEWGYQRLEPSSLGARQRAAS